MDEAFIFFEEWEKHFCSASVFVATNWWQQLEITAL